MQLSRLAISALIFAAMPLLAGDPTTTTGLRNGWGWRLLNGDSKLGYLMGYSDQLYRGALLDAGKTGKPMPSYKDMGWPDLSIGEIAKALDKFFATPENLNIPIYFALFIITHRDELGPENAIEPSRKVFRYNDKELEDMFKK